MTKHLPVSDTTALREAWLTVGRYRTRVTEAGEGDALFLWLPALLDSAAGARRLLRVLSRDLLGVARVAAVDPPGYGGWPRPREGIPSFPDLMEWSRALVRTLPGQIVVAGNSSGSVLAAAAAAESPSVAGLILVCWCDWRQVGTPTTSLVCPSDPEELERLLELSWHRPPPLEPFLLGAHLAQSTRADFRRHVESFDPVSHGADLDRFGGAVAWVGGLSDRVVTPDMIEAAARARPGSAIHWIPRCGHHPHKEAPEVFAELLDRLTRHLLLKHKMES